MQAGHLYSATHVKTNVTVVGFLGRDRNAMDPPPAYVGLPYIILKDSKGEPLLCYSESLVPCADQGALEPPAAVCFVCLGDVDLLNTGAYVHVCLQSLKHCVCLDCFAAYNQYRHGCAVCDR